MFEKEIGRRLGFCLAILCNVMMVIGAATAQAPKLRRSNEGLQVFAISSGSKPDFAKLRTALIEQTDVPVRLPAFLPYIDTKHPVVASLVSTEPSNYEIALGWGVECFSAELIRGAGACHYGTIRGSYDRLTESEGSREPILLAGGIYGYFISSTCGAHCDDAAIGWDENGYHYSISLKAESKKLLIKVANSAITQQHDKILSRK